ncbi:MAG: rubrerythrin family protein [Candidatus Aminicenantes bacterium]|nr:rubrerythrin family protein [Candidatus Aminicenantes bacterium]
MKNLKGTKTAENLMKAFAGESQARNRYTYYAKTAGKEGFKQIEEIFLETAENERSHAKLFYKHLVAVMNGEVVEIQATVEKRHEARYRKLLANVKNQKVFKKDGKVLWKCRECGFVYEGSEAPEKCPVCDHPRDYFEVFVENY